MSAATRGLTGGVRGFLYGQDIKEERADREWRRRTEEEDRATRRVDRERRQRYEDEDRVENKSDDELAEAQAAEDRVYTGEERGRKRGFEDEDRTIAKEDRARGITREDEELGMRRGEHGLAMRRSGLEIDAKERELKQQQLDGQYEKGKAAFFLSDGEDTSGIEAWYKNAFGEDMDIKAEKDGTFTLDVNGRKVKGLTKEQIAAKLAAFEGQKPEKPTYKVGAEGTMYAVEGTTATPVTGPQGGLAPKFTGEGTGNTPAKIAEVDAIAARLPLQPGESEDQRWLRALEMSTEKAAKNPAEAIAAYEQAVMQQLLKNASYGQDQGELAQQAGKLADEYGRRRFGTQQPRGAAAPVDLNRDPRALEIREQVRRGEISRDEGKAQIEALKNGRI